MTLHEQKNKENTTRPTSVKSLTRNTFHVSNHIIVSLQLKLALHFNYSIFMKKKRSKMHPHQCTRSPVISPAILQFIYTQKKICLEKKILHSINYTISEKLHDVDATLITLAG